MEYCFTIPGKMPGLNEYTAANRRSPYKGAKMKKDWQKLVEIEIRRQLIGVHIYQAVEMEYIWYEQNKRRDHDNVSAFGRKVIQDALVQTRVIRDDGWDNVNKYTDVFRLDHQNPRVEVIIREIQVME